MKHTMLSLVLLSISACGGPAQPRLLQLIQTTTTADGDISSITTEYDYRENGAIELIERRLSSDSQTTTLEFFYDDNNDIESLESTEVFGDSTTIRRVVFETERGLIVNADRNEVENSVTQSATITYVDGSARVDQIDARSDSQQGTLTVTTRGTYDDQQLSSLNAEATSTSLVSGLVATVESNVEFRYDSRGRCSRSTADVATKIGDSDPTSRSLITRASFNSDGTIDQVDVRGDTNEEIQVEYDEDGFISLIRQTSEAGSTEFEYVYDDGDAQGFHLAHITGLAYDLRGHSVDAFSANFIEFPASIIR